MREPVSEISRLDCSDGAVDGAFEIANVPCGESTQPSFHFRPGGLDGIQVGRVRRQVEYGRTDRIDRFRYPGDLVSPEVVENDHVSTPQLWSEALPNEAEEQLSRRASQMPRVREPLRPTDRTDDAQRLPARSGLFGHRPRTHRCPGVSPAHRGVAARLVEEDQPLRVDEVHRRLEDGAPLDDVRTVQFSRPDGLFFREKPSRRSVFPMLDVLMLTPVSAFQCETSSASVRSGFSMTLAFKRTASSPRIFAGLPPPLGRGASSPVSRRNANHRFNVASPTPNCSAASSYDIPPPRYASTARFRRSIARGAGMSQLRS